MSDILDKLNDHWEHLNKGRCANCCEVITSYPFFCWSVNKTCQDVLFCGACCQEIKRGFSSALERVAAAQSLVDQGFTLQRDHVRTKSGHIFYPRNERKNIG